MAHETVTKVAVAGTTVAAATPATSARGASGRARAEEVGRDLVVLLTRVGLGILMVWHTKIVWDYTGGPAGMAQGFGQMGIPLPELTARANMYGELIGGILLILGLGVRTIGVLMAVNMVGAWYYVHNSALYAMDHNGPELSIALALLSLMLAVTGPGRLGLGSLRSVFRTKAEPGA
jgi:putative oxidoreductase